jgi:competence protein ComEC
MGGIALSAVVSQYFLQPVPAAIGALVLLLVGFKSRSLMAVVMVVCAGMLLGFLRGDAVQSRLEGYQEFYRTKLAVKGVVSEDVAITNSGKQRIQLQKIIIQRKELPGKVWVETDAKTEIKRGDIVVFEGLLKEGFGNLPAAMYRAKLVSLHNSAHGDIGREVRDWFADIIRKAIKEPEASLGIGFLVGQRSTLPETLDSQLRLLGLTHVVVASGYNLTILVRFTRRLFARVSKYAAFMSALLMVFGFVLMTGFSPSMARAALVTGLSLVAWYFGRSIQPLVLLALVGAATALLNPSFVWGDLGWYLSLLSFAGIMIFAPLIKHYFFGKDAQLKTLPSIVLETMSAQLATLPLIAFIFGQYSPYALLANLLVLPFVPFAMLTTFLTGVTALLAPFLVGVAHWPATLVLRYITAAVDKVAHFPGAAGKLAFTLQMLVLGYVVLGLACLVLWRKTKHNFGKDNVVL